VARQALGLPCAVAKRHGTVKLAPMKPAAPGWRRLGCAAALGAILAFPAGMAFSAREAAPPDAAAAPKAPGGRSGGKTAGRNPYSPDVLGDPHVVDQHRRTVEAMESSCRQTGELCAEAERARDYLVAREGDGRR
jgi:hypothetical protein